jgi:hypothetical protein
MLVVAWQPPACSVRVQDWNRHESARFGDIGRISGTVYSVNDTPRRRGRPTEGQLVSVRLEPNLVTALDQRARARGTTRAKVLRDLVAKSVDPGDGVDRTQIYRQLRMTPAERIRETAHAANELLKFRGMARRRS